jgi:ArsR family transcriptional regulator
MKTVNTSTTVKLAGPAGAALLCVAADPVRWRLLAALAGGTRCVCELQPAAGVTAPALSHHLKVLREAGLVTATRRGRWIDYALAPDAADRLRAALPVTAGTDTVTAGCCTRPAVGTADGSARGAAARGLSTPPLLAAREENT